MSVKSNPLQQVFNLPIVTYKPILSSYNGVNCGQRCAACQQEAKADYDGCAALAARGLENGGSTQLFYLQSQKCATQRQTSLQNCVSNYGTTTCITQSSSLNKCELGCYAASMIPGYRTPLCWDEFSIGQCKDLCNGKTSLKTSTSVCVAKGIHDISECDQGCCFAEGALMNLPNQDLYKFNNAIACSKVCQGKLPDDYTYNYNEPCHQSCIAAQDSCYARSINIDLSCSKSLTQCLKQCPVPLYVPKNAQTAISLAINSIQCFPNSAKQIGDPVSVFGSRASNTISVPSSGIFYSDGKTSITIQSASLSITGADKTAMSNYLQQIQYRCSTQRLLRSGGYASIPDTPFTIVIQPS